MDARLQRRGHSLTPHDVSPRSFQLVARLLTTTGNGFAGKRKKKKSRASSLLAFHRVLLAYRINPETILILIVLPCQPTPIHPAK